MVYSEALRNRFLSPTFAGDIPFPDGAGMEGNVTCGDVVSLALKVEGGLIADARFRAQGCATAIAAADAVCELVTGGSLAAAEVLDAGQLWELLDGIPEEKRNCAAIVLGALRQAVEQARSASLAAGS